MITHDDLSNFKAIVGEQFVSTGESVLNLHCHDESYHKHALPDVVLWPHSTGEVSRIVRYAYERKLPVTA
jgi:D-lactate dehydrogenase (cytochrome)